VIGMILLGTFGFHPTAEVSRKYKRA